MLEMSPYVVSLNLSDIVPTAIRRFHCGKKLNFFVTETDFSAAWQHLKHPNQFLEQGTSVVVLGSPMGQQIILNGTTKVFYLTPAPILIANVLNLTAFTLTTTVKSYEKTLPCGGFTATPLYNPLGGARYRSYGCSSVKSRHSAATVVGCAALYNRCLQLLTGCLYRGVCISDEAQRCLCNVECTAIIGRLCSCLWFVFLIIYFLSIAVCIAYRTAAL